MNSYDESYFDIKLTGGVKATQLIQIEAIFNKGPYKDQSIPLQCKWFRITSSNDYFEIDGLSNAFYQPCVEDVNTKIMVQAIPILDSQKYLGMPLRQETQVLISDPKINEKISIIEQKVGFMEFNCKVENSNLNKIKSGDDFLFTLTSIALCIFDESNSQKLEYPFQNDFPSFKCIRRTNNKGELYLTQLDILTIRFQNNLERDLFLLLLKTFREKNQIKQSPELNNQNIPTNILVKIQALTSQLEQYEMIVKKMTEEQKEFITKNQNQESIIEKQKKEIDILSINQQEIQKKLELSEKQNEKSKTKINYYDQEVKLLKTQIVNLETLNKKLLTQKNDLEQKQTQQPKMDIQSIQELMFREREESLNKHISTLKEEKQQLEAIYEYSIKQNQDLQEQLRQKNEINEIIGNELNSVRKKWESLVQDTEQLQRSVINQQYSQSAKQSPKSNSSKGFKTPSQNNSQILQETSIKQKLENLSQKNQIQEKEEEIINLKTQILKLEQNIQSLKQAHEFDIYNRSLNKRGSVNTNSSEQFLQKLANSLAETITEKDIALENHKQIIKDLVSKIRDLETKQQIKQ